MSDTDLEVIEETARRDAGPTHSVAHLVLKNAWPIALCGHRVSERFGTTAPAMDRCTDCLRIARERNLGYPAWKA